MSSNKMEQTKMRDLLKLCNDKADEDSGYAIAAALTYVAIGLDNLGLRIYADPASGLGAVEYLAVSQQRIAEALTIIADNLKTK